MRVHAIDIYQLDIPMTASMVAAHGTVTSRRTILVRVRTDVGDGWGECVALNEPTYRSDWSDGEWLVLTQLFAPTLVGALVDHRAPVAGLDRFVGHGSARAALELALLDAWSRSRSLPMAAMWGDNQRPVECIGVLSSGNNASAVERFRDLGYRRLKAKIDPSVSPDKVADTFLRSGAPFVAADANGSFVWDDPSQRRLLQAFDEMGLAYFEQPARTVQGCGALRKQLQTPIGLDESIGSYEVAEDAVESGACDLMVVKPSNVGGWRAAADIIELCASHSVDAHVGAMLETGVGRAAVAALAAAHDVAAELSYDGRWLEHSLVLEPAPIDHGEWRGSERPGLGVTVDEAALQSYLVHHRTVRP